MQTIEERRAKNAQRAREWRKKHPGDPRKGKRAKYTAQYRETEGYKKAQEKYKNSEKRKATNRLSLRQARLLEPLKSRARDAVKHAVKSGRLQKPKCCQACGNSGLIHGHHEDYSQKLAVIWVCPPCHTKIHKGSKQ
jgi:hypothetical protein